MPFKHNSFDGVICLYTLIHIPRKHHLSILKKFYRILRPKGSMLISVGLTDTKEKIENYHGVRMYWSYFDRKKNLELIGKVGFLIKWKKVVGPSSNRHLFIFAVKE